MILQDQLNILYSYGLDGLMKYQMILFQIKIVFLDYLEINYMKIVINKEIEL